MNMRNPDSPDNPDWPYWRAERWLDEEVAGVPADQHEALKAALRQTLKYQLLVAQGNWRRLGQELKRALGVKP